MEETDFRAALRSWRWPDFERFLLVHPDGCFTQAAISSQLDVARSATRELECALRELEARDFDEARACIEHGRRLGVANLDAAWADLVRRLDAADPPASMDLARARLAGGDGASALTIVSKLALDDPMDDLARTWRAALQAVGGGADARRAEDDLRGLAARKGAAGTLAASVVEELQPSAWPEGSGRYPCAACGYPVLLDGVFCPHCLWPQRSMSLIRALSNSVRTTFEHEGSTLTSIVTTYAAPSGTRGAPGRPAVPLPRSWTLGHEAGMLRRVSSNVGLEPTSRWSGWRCDGEGASDARRAAWEMVLPHSPWRERGVTRLLLGEPLEPSHLVAPGHLAPFLPWERLSRFEVGHDADSHVEWLRDEESGCVYDVRFAAENLLSIVGRDNGYSRQLEYKDGRVVAERLVLPERGEFKLDYHWKPQLQKVEIRSSRDNFDVTMQ